MTNTKKNSGGKRPGSGRKKRAPTVTASFRVDSESLQICRTNYGRTINAKVNDFIKRLAKKVEK